MKTVTLILITLSFFNLYGCSNETIELSKPSQTPVVVVMPSRTPVVAPTKTLDSDGDNHQIRRVRDGGEFCENYLLKKIAKTRAEGSRIVKLKVFNADDETLSPELKKWLELMWEDRTNAYELRHGSKKALLVRSYSRHATGLSASFESWFIQLDNHSNEFFSFSEEPKLIFFDKDGLLNYYAVIYSDEFIENKDWDNLTVNLLLYRVNADGKSQLVSKKQNVKCE